MDQDEDATNKRNQVEKADYDFGYSNCLRPICKFRRTQLIGFGIQAKLENTQDDHGDGEYYSEDGREPNQTGPQCSRWRR